jgi:hypothetical protein
MDKKNYNHLAKTLDKSDFEICFSKKDYGSFVLNLSDIRLFLEAIFDKAPKKSLEKVSQEVIRRHQLNEYEF